MKYNVYNPFLINNTILWHNYYLITAVTNFYLSMRVSVCNISFIIIVALIELVNVSSHAKILILFGLIYEDKTDHDCTALPKPFLAPVYSLISWLHK